MTVYSIRIAGDPVLHQATSEIDQSELGTAALRTLVDDMFETMYAADGVGLAANQIGLGKRLFVYDCPDGAGARHKGHVINPILQTTEIPETMPDPDDDVEGCLSVPGENYPTGRADWAQVTGIDVDGNPVEVDGTGFFARCLQHETDHLDGYIYLDRLTGRYARAAKKMLKRRGWGVAGQRWNPAEFSIP